MWARGEEEGELHLKRRGSGKRSRELGQILLVLFCQDN